MRVDDGTQEDGGRIISSIVGGRHDDGKNLREGSVAVFPESSVVAFPSAEHEEPGTFFHGVDDMFELSRLEGRDGVIAQDVERVALREEIVGGREAGVDAIEVDSLVGHDAAEIGGGSSRVVVA